MIGRPPDHPAAGVCRGCGISESCNLPARLLLGIAIVAAGCQDLPVPDDLPPLLPVTILVMQDAQPLSEATVVLASPDFHWSVGGVTDAAGVAVLWTSGRYRGAPAGSYRVTVTKDEVVEKPNPRHRPGVDNMPVLGMCIQTVEPKYRLAKTTPLELVIGEDLLQNATPHATFDVGKPCSIPVR